MAEPDERDEAEQVASTSEQEAEEQAKLEALYLEQLRRRSCPSCGEGYDIF